MAVEGHIDLCFRDTAGGPMDELDEAIETAGGEAVARGRECDRVRIVAVCLDRGDEFAAGDVPELNRAAAKGGREQVALRRKGSGKDRVARSFDLERRKLCGQGAGASFHNRTVAS